MRYTFNYTNFFYFYKAFKSIIFNHFKVYRDKYNEPIKLLWNKIHFSQLLEFLNNLSFQYSEFFFLFLIRYLRIEYNLYKY